MCDPAFLQPSLLNLKLYTALKITEARNEGVKLGLDMFFEPNQLTSWYQSLDHPFFLCFARSGTELRIVKVDGEVTERQNRRYFQTQPAQAQLYNQKHWMDGPSLLLEKTYYLEKFVYHGASADPRILAFHLETVTGAANMHPGKLHLFKVTVAPRCVQENAMQALSYTC